MLGSFRGTEKRRRRVVGASTKACGGGAKEGVQVSVESGEQLLVWGIVGA